MKRRISILAIAAASTVLLVGCGNRNKISTNSGSQKTQLTGSNSNNDYQSLIKDGHYQVSKAAGINGQQTSNQFNLQGFQRGLLEISKQNFSPDKYIFQEGQQLSATTVQNWVGRKTDDNPDGLNPNQPKDKVVPEYLQQIEEQDFLQTVDGKTELKGMTIGVGLNSVYYYTKEKYGAQYSKNLTDAEIESNGKEIANQILVRLRKQTDLKNIPIVVALYKAAPDDSLVGGNFIASSNNAPQSTKVDNWKTIDQKNYVFPIANGQKAPNDNDAAAFDQFKQQAQSYFPNLSGVTAQAQYTNGTLTGMHVNVTTQFYSYTAINSFTQYLQTSAQKYLPQNSPIEITVGSTNGIQSYLYRGQDQKKFSSHVFTNY